MENDEKLIDEIKEKIFTKKPDLVIDRVPEKANQVFKEFAREEFCNDYGMTLKFLLDFYLGLIPTGTEQMELKIMQLEQSINELKSSSKEDKNDGVIKMANGREIRRNR